MYEIKRERRKERQREREKDNLIFLKQYSQVGLTKYLMSDENAPILHDRLDIYQDT
jgi:hypothetical protein